MLQKGRAWAALQHHNRTAVEATWGAPVEGLDGLGWGGDETGGASAFLRNRLDAALTILRSSHQWLRGRLYWSSNIGGVLSCELGFGYHYTTCLRVDRAH